MSTIILFILAGMACTIVFTLLFLAGGRADRIHESHEPGDYGMRLPIPSLPQGWGSFIHWPDGARGKMVDERHRRFDNAPPMPEGHPATIIIPPDEEYVLCSFDEYKDQMRKLLAAGKRRLLEQCYPGLDLDWFMQDADNVTPIQKETC